MSTQPTQTIQSSDSIWSVSLPAIASVLVIATLPPFNFWPIGFFAVAPIYFFIKINIHASWWRIMLGGVIFSFIFSAFLMAQTLLQFHWIEEAYLFSTLVKISFIPLLALICLLSSLNFLILRLLLRKSEVFNICIVALAWTASEWVIKMTMFSIEYSILGYPAHNTFFVTLAGVSVFGAVGGVFLVVFCMALINMSVGSILFEIFKRKNISKTITAPLIIIIGTFLVGYCAHIYQSSHLRSQSTGFKSVKIATIQDQDRIGETFGKETEGVFEFKTLEGLLKIAYGESPDIIIYPFAPWNGVIYSKDSRSRDTKSSSMNSSSSLSVDPIIFDKDIFAVSFEAFGEWEKKHVAGTTVFVTWATTYRDTKFYNEVTYWKNGKLIGTHQKEHLFPFLDYSPKIAQSFGLYTTAIDGTSGTSTLQEKINDVQVGALVCSEVTHPVDDSTSRESDLILSIGSEAFFSSSIAGELNLANASYRAAESGIPIIRANRFGPSAFIDQTGKTVSYMPYGVTGVLVDTIQVPISDRFRP